MQVKELLKCETDNDAKRVAKKAIVDNLPPRIQGPGIESQITSLYQHETAIAKFKTERRIVEKRDGTKTYPFRLMGYQ